MNVPKELMYTKSHEWVKTVDETTVVVGLTIMPRTPWETWCL